MRTGRVVSADRIADDDHDNPQFRRLHTVAHPWCTASWPQTVSNPRSLDYETNGTRPTPPIASHGALPSLARTDRHGVPLAQPAPTAAHSILTTASTTAARGPSRTTVPPYLSPSVMILHPGSRVASRRPGVARPSLPLSMIVGACGPVMIESPARHRCGETSTATSSSEKISNLIIPACPVKKRRR
jgi:hypothetical protein